MAAVELTCSDYKFRKRCRKTLSKHTTLKRSAIIVVIPIGKAIDNPTVNSPRQKLADIIIVVKLPRVVLKRRQKVHLFCQLSQLS